VLVMSDSVPSKERDLLRVLLEEAELTPYGHGGGRLAITRDDNRELIADFYGDGEWREFFMKLIRDAAKAQSAHEPPAEPIGFVAMSGRILCTAFAKPGEQYELAVGFKWVPVYTRPASPPSQGPCSHCECPECHDDDTAQPPEDSEPTLEDWAPAIRDCLMICRDFIDGKDIDPKFLRISVQTILDEWPTATKEPAPCEEPEDREPIAPGDYRYYSPPGVDHG
jgi:hypothetical protein